MPITRNLLSITLLGIVVLSPGHAAAISIEFDYSYDGGFFSDANVGRRAYLEDAGSWVGSRLEDSLNAIENNTIGSFQPSFYEPATKSTFTAQSRNVAANTLVIYVGGRNLPHPAAAQGGPGSYVPTQVAGSDDAEYFAWDRNVRYRGEQANGATGSSNTSMDFGPWGGGIFFDTGLNFYYDNDLTTVDDISGYDFFSIAIHEIGHVLGIGTAPSWNRVTDEESSRFFGDRAVASHGATVPLTGDDDHWAHWANGTRGKLDGALVETALDPIIKNGTRKYYTELDWAGLADIGWEVSADVLPPAQGISNVPLPASMWLLLGALAGLSVLGRRRHGGAFAIPA